MNSFIIVVLYQEGRAREKGERKNWKKREAKGKTGKTSTVYEVYYNIIIVIINNYILLYIYLFYKRRSTKRVCFE